MNAQARLSNEDRARLRKAITAHPDWPAYRAEHGVTSADLTSARCLEAATALCIDVQSVIDGHVDVVQTPDEKPAPAAAPVAAPDPADVLGMLRQVIGGQVDAAQVKAIVDQALEPVLADLGRPVKVVAPDGAAMGKELPPVRHPMAETLVRACASRTVDGHRLNVWIAGPAGSGKTFAAQQAAGALGIEYGFHGAMTMAHELTGFVDAGGTYHETIFVRLYRDGGLCLLDEVDAGSSEALLALNAALANGRMALPNGQMIERHPDFVCIGAANTWGNGATAEYIGRARIDAAFLDRFGVRLAWDYDPKLERAICGDEDWARRVQNARDAARKAGLKVMITPRASMTGAALIASGMTPDEAAKVTYLAGLTDEQVKQIEGAR